MKLIRTYKDEKRLYFLTEYVSGQDLFDVIRDIGLLKDEEAKFYTACLLTTIEYLHDRDIIYRDLKPENVMVGADGYPKLIDFGSAVICKDRTYTVVGTPHYMAPEMITGKGYECSVDHWSLGIMVYEFLCGGVPFGDDLEEPYEIYERILTGELTYPSFV
jgi:cGMP-dependent protein kinase